MKVSYDKLDEAFSLNGDEIAYWVDKLTGRVILISHEFLDDEAYFEDDEELAAAREILMLSGEIDNDPQIVIDEDRYVEIVPPGSDEKWKWMESFTLSHVEDETLQTKLVNALRGKKPFRKVKDILAYYPAFEQKWFEFEAQKLREFIEEWARFEQLEIDYDKE